MAFTSLSTLGEFGLINRWTIGLDLADDIIQGVGDDCAVLDYNGPEVLLISTDSLVEGVHFDTVYAPLQLVGFKAISTAVSDVYAMNGRPVACTVALQVSARYSVELMDELYVGVRKACDLYGVSLVGGDTTSSRHDLVITVTILGLALREEVVYRSGATPGDVLCVTGDLGSAYAGLQILQREREVLLANPEVVPDFEGYRYVVGRQLQPQAQKLVVQQFIDLGVQPTAMIDLSDGLAGDLQHLAKASGVNFHVFQDKLPIAEETDKVSELMKIPRTTYALYGGEDYELLFTVSQANYLKIEGKSWCIPIGHAVDFGSGNKLVLPTGDVLPIEPMSYDHFKPAV